MAGGRDMIPCSAIVLTRNEVDNLDRCFASLRWCREIIVVDSGSADGTQEKAAKLGAKVYVHVQQGPFNIAEQRNWALDNTGIKDGWVLFLDADETVPSDLQRDLCAVVVDSNPAHLAYELTPRYLFWGRWLKRTQGFPNWHPRFLRWGSTRFVGGVWEHFELSSPQRLATPYDHYANSKGLSDWVARHDRYSTWDAGRIFEFLENPSDETALGTKRKLRLRKLAARFWPLRPLARFFTMYVLRGGFVEGLPALVFCLLYAGYEFMIVVKIVEKRRKHLGLPL